MTAKKPKLPSHRMGLLCSHCGTIIVSLYRHDFRTCLCEGDKFLAIDGGGDYTKISAGKKASYTTVNVEFL